MTYKLFTYGTLKRGNRNHYLVKEAQFLGEYYMPKGYKLTVDGDLPCLTEDHEGDGCYGEVYEVTAAQLKACDRLEGHPYLYKREMLDVRDLETRIKEPAYVYIFQGEPNGIVVRRY